MFHVRCAGGNFGNYGRQTSFRGGSSVDEQYATRLRNATKTMQQPDAKQRVNYRQHPHYCLVRLC